MDFWKYTFIALIVLIAGFVTYDNQKNLKTQNQFSEQETALGSVQTNNTLKDSIVEYGIKFSGTPYVAGGSGKDGFDCSGFVYFVFQHFKIKVPRSSADYENFGIEIPIENVLNGDLLLFLSPTRNVIGHIGIVTNANGRESDFIHAASGREMKVVITNLSSRVYTRRFVKAIRVL